MEQRSRDYKVRVRGDLACFTRPEFKVERVSYEVMTPSSHARFFTDVDPEVFD